MTDFRRDGPELALIEPVRRSAIDQVIRGQAAVAEFTVGTMFEGRPALTLADREVAVAFSALAELLGRRAQEACEAGDPKWEGLADAETIVHNELGRRSLPQLPRGQRSDYDDELQAGC